MSFLAELSSSDWAAWYAAFIATIVFVWDIVKWKKEGPNLKITVSPGAGSSEFRVSVTNIGNLPALIESVDLKCFYRGPLILRREFDLGEAFSLFGNGSFPPLKLDCGELWSVGIGPALRVPLFPKGKLLAIVEVRASHRRRPFRISADAARFNVWAHSIGC